MADTPPPLTDDQLDDLLRATAARIDIPLMSDAAALARARIEARAPRAGGLGQTDAVFPLPTTGQPAVLPDEIQPNQLVHEQRSRLRELALFGGGLAAAALIAVALAFIFRGFNEPAPIAEQSAPPPDGGPLAAKPYDIPGYEFVGTAGQPMVPNEPVDVAVGPDGTLFVLDTGLRRIVAFNADGEVRTDWGDRGFSQPLLDAYGATSPSIGVGQDGNIFVAAEQVLVFDPSGTQIDSWPFPGTFNDETQGVLSQGLVVDSAGNVYVAGRGVVWRFEAGTGAATTLELDAETDVQLGIDSQDQLYAASLAGGIYRVGEDGALEFVGRTTAVREINGFAVAPDGGFVMFQSSRSSEEPSTFVIFDEDGSETASWSTDRTGYFFGNLGPLWIGVDVTAEGTIVLPDPLGHRVSYYDADGTLVSEIRDERPGAFGQLWRIDVDGDGNVLGYDPSVAPKVVRFAPNGEFLRAMPFEADLLGVMTLIFEGNGFAATEDGGFIIANQQSSRISIYSPEGELIQEWGEMDATRSGGGLAFPDAIAVDHEGFIYIVDEGFAGRLVDNLRKFTVDGEFVAEVGSIGYPARADIVHHDGAIWAVDDGSIARFPDDGGEPEAIARPDTDESDGNLPGWAVTLALDPDGNILTYMFRLDDEPGQFPAALAKLDPQGNVIWTTDIAENAGNLYVDLAIAPDGTLYLSDSEQRQILVYRPDSES